MKKTLFLFSILILLVAGFLIFKANGFGAKVTRVTTMPETILPGDPVLITVDSRSNPLPFFGTRKNFRFSNMTEKRERSCRLILMKKFWII